MKQEFEGNKDEKLDKLMEEADKKMGAWVTAINEQNRQWFKLDGATGEDTDNELLNNATAALGEISDMFISYCGAKDNFNNRMMSLSIHGPVLYIKSEKLNFDIQLGIDNKGIYLTSYLRAIENIRFMGDGFYQQLLSLDETGDFDVKEYELYSEEVTAQFREVFSSGKSKLFRIVRSGIVAASSQVTDPISPYIEISWPYNVSINQAIAGGCRAFKTIYRLNYELWKISDLKEKGKW